MKRAISIFLAASMLALLCACSGAPAADTPDPAEPDTDTAVEPQQTAEPAEPEAERPDTELSDEQLIALYLARQFCSSDFFARISADYEEMICKAPREPEVTHATVYELGDMEGVAVNVLMLRLAADWLYADGNGDSLFILIDLETGKIYDSLTADGTWGTLLNCMHSHTDFDSDIIWSENESYTDFTGDEIAAVNAALASGQEVDINVAEMTAEKKAGLRAGALAAAGKAVKDFCGSEDFVSAAEAFAEVTCKENPVSVGDAIIYNVKNLYGREVYCVLVRIDAGIAAGDIMYDNVVLLVYPDSGETRDSLTTDMGEWSDGFSGICENDEDINNLLMNTFVNYSVFGGDTMARPDTEVISPFTEAELAELNGSIAE